MIYDVPPSRGQDVSSMVIAAAAPDLETDSAARRLIAIARGRGFAIAFDLLADRGEAEDAVQDALVKAIAWESRLRNPGALEAWFLRTLANGCIRTLRRRRVMRAFARLVGSRGEPTAEPRTEPDRVRLLAELDRLPSMQKASIVLRYGHDLSLDEIAATLEVSSETVKTHLKRAHARLRLRLGVAMGGPDE
jgi:RNA polymerase sigma-70 factor (ECF subfamily)